MHSCAKTLFKVTFRQIVLQKHSYQLSNEVDTLFFKVPFFRTSPLPLFSLCRQSTVQSQKNWQIASCVVVVSFFRQSAFFHTTDLSIGGHKRSSSLGPRGPWRGYRKLLPPPPSLTPKLDQNLYLFFCSMDWSLHSLFIFNLFSK